MRAFRPGRYAAVVDEEEVSQIKQARMQLYAARAKARLPLFDDIVVVREPETGKLGSNSDRLSA